MTQSSHETRNPSGPRPRRRSPAASSSTSWRTWLLAVLAVTLFVYIPSLDNDFTNWDDTIYVTQNRLVANPNLRDLLITPVNGAYHPVTNLSFALDYQLFLLRPGFFHGVSLLVHLANTALTFLFVRRLVGGGLWAPAVTSLLFGIHPMHVESVAWIAERKDVLYAFFYLLGMLAHLRYVEARRPVWWILTLLAFVLSAASKPAAAVFPLTLFAIDWYRRRPWSLSLLVEKVPFVALSVVIGILNVHAQKAAGAVADVPLWAPLERVLLAGQALVLYVLKLFVPLGLSAIYPMPDPKAGLGVEYYVSTAALLVGLALVAFLARRNRDVLFGIAFFLINIVLVLQLVPFGISLIADRFTYLPYIGVFFALSRWMDDGPSPSTAGSPVRTAVAGVLLLLIPASLYLAWKRCEVWQNSETLWNDVIRRYPISVAFYHRGHHYHYVGGKPQAALADYDRALGLNPGNAHVWTEKGTLLANLNQADEAYAAFDRAIAIHAGSAKALSNRGVIKGQRGDLEGAIADFTQAIAADPTFREPCKNRAVAYTMLGKHDLAVSDSRRAIELEPANPENHAIHDAMGVNFQALHRFREAIAEHDAAIRTAPHSDPRIATYYVNRSLAWMGLGDRERAWADVQEAQRRGVDVGPEFLQGLGTGETAP
jgi:protein O-mannosyl-transferase